MIKTEQTQETQTYLDETNPHFEAVSKAYELFEKDPNDEAKKAVKESYTAYKATREALAKRQADAKVKTDADKAAFEKSRETFLKTEPVVPKDSLVSLERVQALKKYSAENGLTEEQFNGMVKYDNDLLQGQKAYSELTVKNQLATYEAELVKNPKFSVANRAESDRKIDALYKAKAKPELLELIKTVPQANHPLFKEFLLSIAEGMDADELVGGETRRNEEIPGYAKEFSKTAEDARKAGVRPRG